MSSLSTQIQSPAAPQGVDAALWKKPLIAAAVLAGVFALVFWDFLERQVALAYHEQADWGHTLVAPLIAGYFVYVNRHKLLAKPFKTTWIGLLPVVLGVAWYIECSIGLRPLQHHNLQALGVATTMTGLVLMFCGWRAMIWLWFPLAYLFVFGQYISPRFLNIITFRMQDITAHGAFLVMQAFMDTERQGNTLYIYTGGGPDGVKPLNIAEACSGMRMLMAFMALAVAMAYLGFKRNWQRVLLVLLAVPTAIFVNVLRVVTLGVLSLFDTEFAAGDFHTFIGLVWLVPAFMIFLGIMWVIRNLIVEPGQPVARAGGAKA